MDLIYANSGRTELGVLRDFTLDMDVAKDMDFELKASASNVILEIGYYWYVADTEYGGRIDDRKIDSATNMITYSGRTWRGILDSYIAEPPPGEPYLIVSGDLGDITASRLSAAGISALFRPGSGSASIGSFAFDRYTTVYRGLVKAAKTASRSMGILWSDGWVEISYHAINDYSDSIEYSQDSGMDFTLEERSAKANHLICLGSGELENRMVLHLYRQLDGSTGYAKVYVGLEEVTDVLDYPSVESIEELEKSGRDRMEELSKSKAFSLRVNDLGLLIDDVVASRDRITGMTMTGSVANIIVRIRDGRATQEYIFGG
jgi:hypothetical protein